MSRLGLGLGITKGGVIPFNPLSLDPYLLFDTQSSMIGTFENPTLDLDPSVPSTLDVITATRTGVATYTDADGLIQSADPNTVRVDQTQGAELTPTKFQNIGYTDFSQDWTALNTTVVAGDGFGGYASQKITAGISGNRFFTGDVSGVISGTAYTVSFYVRRLTGSGRVDLIHNNITGSPIAQSLTITSEFTRVTAQFNGATNGTTATNIQFRLFTAGDQIEISQPQVEEGTTASDFVANTTGSPKFITGATYGPRVPMILVEPSATNLVPYSEDFSNAGWSKQNDVAVTSSSANSPDGTTNAFKITGLESTDGDGGLIERVGASASTTYTFSVYLKALGNDDVGKKVRLRLKRNGGALVTSNQQVVLSSEWVRHSVTITLLSDNTGVDSMISKDTSSPSAERADECLIWGAQLELGSAATSLIPTSGSTAQRAADNLVISGSAFSDFYNGSEGTFYVEVVDRQVTGSSHSYIVGQSASQFFLYKDSGSAQITSFDAGTGINKSPLVANQLMRLALTYKSASPASRSLSLDGSTSPGSYNGNFSSANILKIGGGYSDVFSGYFRRILFWPTHSSRL